MKTVLFIVLLLGVSVAGADVYPDPAEPGIDSFIKITKHQGNYSFELCLLDERDVCQSLTNKKSYTLKELNGKIKALKAKGKKAGAFGFFTLGLSLLGTAEFYFMRRTIDPKRIMRKKVLKYKVAEDGDVSGRFDFYKRRMIKALNQKPIYD